jgi:hypothetical protein
MVCENAIFKKYILVRLVFFFVFALTMYKIISLHIMDIL